MKSPAGCSAGAFSWAANQARGSALAAAISPGRAPRPKRLTAIAPSRVMPCACVYRRGSVARRVPVSINGAQPQLRRGTMPSYPKNGLTYKASGVDIDAGEALVDRIAPAAKATRRAGADAALG